MGRLLNTSPKYESLAFIDLQCFACMDPKEGSLGSKVTANTGPSLFLGLDFFLNASSCGISLALFIAESMIYSGWSLYKSEHFNSLNCFSRFVSSVQVLTILSASEYGMATVVCLLWQLLGSRYWFLSVSFLKRSTSILPSFIVSIVSRNGIELLGRPSHWSSFGSYRFFV